MDRCRPDLLLEWAPLLCPELVERSLERPLVSGFYRLITLVFRETARAGYFDPDPPLLSASSSTTHDINAFPMSPGSVVDAIGVGKGNERGGSSESSGKNKLSDGAGGGGVGGEDLDGDDTRSVSAHDERGEDEEGSGTDYGGRLVCRRVLCR